MGSGKRNYKKRPKKFSLGAYKPEKEGPKDPEVVKALIEFWESRKKKKVKPSLVN